MPYVFQLFAALLEARPDGPLSDFYKALIAPVLMPTLWESKGNGKKISPKSAWLQTFTFIA
jgi:exportin-2 (importin alpha re-exporter)